MAHLTFTRGTDGTEVNRRTAQTPWAFAAQARSTEGIAGEGRPEYGNGPQGDRQGRHGEVLTLPGRLETEVQRATIAFYESFGCEIRRFSERRTGRTRVAKGWPDLVVFCPQKAAHWLHETKREKGGRQSPEQVSLQELAASCGLDYVIGGVQAASEHLTLIGLLAR